MIGRRGFLASFAALGALITRWFPPGELEAEEPVAPLPSLLERLQVVVEGYESRMGRRPVYFFCSRETLEGLAAEIGGSPGGRYGFVGDTALVIFGAAYAGSYVPLPYGIFRVGAHRTTPDLVYIHSRLELSGRALKAPGLR